MSDKDRKGVTLSEDFYWDLVDYTEDNLAIPASQEMQAYLAFLEKQE